MAVRKGTAPAVGEFVALKAAVAAARSRCGRAATTLRATCISSGSAPPVMCSARSRSRRRRSRPDCALRTCAFVDGVRETIDDRIREILPGDRGSIASALITGKRDAITPPVNDAMYVSSLAHVLSISGYHMAVVAGIVFFVFARVARADSLARQPPSDQEMGGLAGTRGGHVLPASCRAPRSRPSAPSS